MPFFFFTSTVKFHFPQQGHLHRYLDHGDLMGKSWRCQDNPGDSLGTFWLFQDNPGD